MLAISQLIGFGAIASVASAVLGSNKAWVCGGVSGSTLKTATQTYDLGTGTVAAAAALGTARSAGAGASDNFSKAVISHGYNPGTGLDYTNTTEKITLPAGTWSNSATVANQAGRMGGGCSCGTHLFGALSDNPSDNSATNKTEKYNFTADTTAAGGTLTNSLFRRCGAHGVAATSWVVGGGVSTTHERYTHASDTTSNLSGTVSGTSYGSCAGNATYHYTGNNDTSNFTATLKYTLSSETQAAGTSLTASFQAFYACASTSAKQLFAAGTATQVYTFSGDTTAAGTAITDVGNFACGFAEAPGGLN